VNLVKEHKEFIAKMNQGKYPDPLPLQGDHTENWNLFDLDFENYLVTIGEDNASEKVKIAHMINVVGIPIFVLRGYGIRKSQ